MFSNLQLNDTESPLGGFRANFEDSRYVVFGVPFEKTSTYRKGCQYGPNGLREAAKNIESTNIFNGNDIFDSWVCDLGDITATKRSDIFSQIRAIASSCKLNAKIPLMIGGEHTITSCMGKVFKDALFIIFDAHADLRDSYNNSKWSHACTVRRLLDDVDAERVIQIGLRAFSKEEKAFAISKKIKQFYAMHSIDLLTQEFSNHLTSLQGSYDGIYLSIDMDVFDPAFAPGVGNPEALGLSSWDVFKVLQLLPNLCGMDITELSPKNDVGGISQILAARLAYYLLSR